jgi:hypothetical protein
MTAKSMVVRMYERGAPYAKRESPDGHQERRYGEALEGAIPGILPHALKPRHYETRPGKLGPLPGEHPADALDRLLGPELVRRLESRFWLDN